MRRFFHFVALLLPVSLLLACSKVPATPNVQGRKIPHWLELPETADGIGPDFFSRNCKISGRTFRNYSYYWDYSNRVSLWVAYPLNSSYFGDSGRSETWGYDPYLPAAKQQNVSGGYSKNGTVWYQRVQQLPSNDRTASDEINATTFYGTNIVPMIHDLNESVWSTIEGKVHSWAALSDTLYVVSGCVVKGAKDYVLDRSREKITIPVAFYKAVLRYSKNSTQGYNGYMGAAFWYEHEGYPDTFSKSQSMSIAALEKKLGYVLFVNLPGVTGESDAEKIKNENPAAVNWWWR
ncbi:MAG: DNA/RNA non-specific endonuclease [Bacteroidales bacterium]|nr:DNA/RNA non-specific endonuclease [Bacteroidales bacterium]